MHQSGSGSGDKKQKTIWCEDLTRCEVLTTGKCDKRTLFPKGNYFIKPLRLREQREEVAIIPVQELQEDSLELKCRWLRRGGWAALNWLPWAGERDPGSSDPMLVFGAEKGSMKLVPHNGCYSCYRRKGYCQLEKPRRQDSQELPAKSIFPSSPSRLPVSL